MHNSIKEQSSKLCGTQLPLPYKTRGQMDIFHEFFNAGEYSIAINNNRDIDIEIYGLQIKLSGWNRNKIQLPMRSISEVLALLAYATTLGKLFHIGDHM